MADIVVTAAQAGVVFPDEAEIFDFIAAATITALQSLYINSSGKVDLCDANSAGKEQFRGIALSSVGAGQAVSVVKRGHIYGFTVSALAYDAILYQSDTAGALADAASGTKTIRAARVVPLSDSNLTKVVYVSADWLNNW